jgi:hypothetical protein
MPRRWDNAPSRDGGPDPDRSPYEAGSFRETGSFDVPLDFLEHNAKAIVPDSK